MALLTAEQIDLLHHVELAEAGWQDRLWEQLVVATSIRVGPVSEPDLLKHVVAFAGSGQVGEQVSRAVERLLSRALLVISAGKLTASQETLTKARDGARRFEAIQQEAEATYEGLLRSELPNLDGQLNWDWFVHRCLEPLVSTLGARTYELLTTGLSDAGNSGHLARFLEDVQDDHQVGIRRVIERFFGTANVSVRGYVLRLVHANLMSSAARLPKASLDNLNARMRSPVVLKVLLDTNFVFSILGLHENPANEAAAELMRLVQQVANKVRVSLYVTPITVDEARRTLRLYERRLKEVPVSPQVGSAALHLDGELSGIAVKYFEAVAKAKHRLSIADYLGPYLENLVEVLRAKGVELYNHRTDALSVSQPVIDDILEQQEFETKRFGQRAKSYEKLLHDVTLWHLADSQRPRVLESPLDAVYWITTVDYRLLGFDGFKHRGGGGSVPVCVHPTVLIQMLQFWLPRSADMESALFESLGALLPQAFDSEAEAMCLKIMGALSRFENVDDLPTETITSILLNRALRSRLQGAASHEAEIALVKDAIIEEAVTAKNALEQERQRVEALRNELDAANAARSADQAQARTSLEEQKQHANELAAKLDAERAKQSEWARDFERLQKWVDGEQRRRIEEEALNRERTRRLRERALVCSVLGALVLVLIGSGWFAAQMLEEGGVSRGRARFASSAVFVGAWTVCLWLCGHFESVSIWRPYVVVRNALAWIAGAIWATFLGNTAWAMWTE